MKIASIIVNLTPNETEKEQNRTNMSLIRNEEKVWTSTAHDGIGLHPWEIKLANDIQDLISKFNGGSK